MIPNRSLPVRWATGGCVVAALSGISCHSQKTVHLEPSRLAGEWNVAKVVGGPVHFGLFLEEPAENRLHGVLRRVLSGDVELEVDGYTAIEGTIVGNRVILGTTNAGGQRLEFEFEMESDSLRVVQILWSGESLVVDTNSWSAWRGS